MAWCEAFLNKGVLSTEYSLDYGLSAGGLYQCHIFTWRPKSFATGVDNSEEELHIAIITTNLLDLNSLATFLIG